MSTTDRCPSTGKPGTLATAKRDERAALEGARAVSHATGKAFWRSLDDLVGTRAFKDFLQREFPANASELLDGSRRHFLKIMGASLALAGAATIPGCRRPDHKILAYNTAPEGIIPGKPLFYATALPTPGGGCEGLLATTFEGRPTKLDGNPLHPYNRGKSSIRSQAHILSLYDPDRAPDVARARTEGAIDAGQWDDFRADAPTDFGAFDSTNGRGLAFLVDKVATPTRDRLKRDILRRWPEVNWHVYASADDTGMIEGTRLAFGEPMRPEHRLENADTIVCIDDDLLGSDGSLVDARGYGLKRFVPGEGSHRARDAEMSRVYVIESGFSVTGGQADHRLALRPSRIGAFVVALAQRVMQGAAGGSASRLADALGRVAQSAGAPDIPDGWLDALVDDLVGTAGSRRGTSVVTCGPTQPAWVHALVGAINGALGNVGRTVVYRPIEGDLAADSVGSMRDLCDAMRSGSIDTLVVLDGNPVYDAPADLAFAENLGGVRRSIYVGTPNETAAAVTDYYSVANGLETWGDAVANDGTYTITQPMIAPLYGGKSVIETLGMILGLSPDGYELVRDTLSDRVSVPRRLGGVTLSRFEKIWRRTLHDGLLAASTDERGATPDADLGSLAGEMEALPAGTFAENGVEAVFQACQKVGDGRDANNGWLQELPDAVNKIAWDNPVQMSRATAEALGLDPSRRLGARQYNEVQVVEIAIDGRTIQAPLWVVPGMADDPVILTLGYGRTQGGRICEGTGTDVSPLRTSAHMRHASGVGVTRAPGRRPYLIATTQDHWTMEGRDFYREVDLYWWKKEGDTNFNIDEKGNPKKDSYKRKRNLKPADMLGIEGHAPVNEEIYLRGNRRGGQIYYHRVDDKGKDILDGEGRRQHPLNKSGKPVQQWGMSIDLTTCTGCNACVTACQAENNIPIVGKKEVAKGREMHWIRVDRYFASEKMSSDDGAAWSEPDFVVQPVACVHCENAPCEVVCPVNATVHSERGTNDMAYNRCVGTRYCSNNCPYKVRRFNYFDYATKKYEGDVYGAPSDVVVPQNKNLVPPRLREKIDEVQTMVNNPNVTVRSRGVMEKCTYCIQRINAASVETKLEDLKFIPDGFFQVACQQACPTGAIVFGDIYDYLSHDGQGSLVSRAKEDPRTYAMLAYLAIFPRTTYQMRIRNPHPLIRAHSPHNPFKHGHDDHDETHDGGGHSLRLPVLNNTTSDRVGAMA